MLNSSRQVSSARSAADYPRSFIHPDCAYLIVVRASARQISAHKLPTFLSWPYTLGISAAIMATGMFPPYFPAYYAVLSGILHLKRGSTARRASSWGMSWSPPTRNYAIIAIIKYILH